MESSLHSGKWGAGCFLCWIKWQGGVALPCIFCFVRRVGLCIQSSLPVGKGSLHLFGIESFRCLQHLRQLGEAVRSQKMPCVFHSDDGGVQSGGEFAAFFGGDQRVVATHDAGNVRRRGADGRQIQPGLFHIIIDGITFECGQLRRFGGKGGHQIRSG